MSNICYLLCQYPEYQTKLYEEVRDLPDNGGVIDDQHLQDKDYLLGVINETLRLHPPVPSGLQRLTPPQGAVIVCSEFIPKSKSDSKAKLSAFTNCSLTLLG